MGLGGVLTATGLGTEVSKDKQVVTVENRAYLLETPLKADVALIAAQQADYLGNLIYTLTAQNFNPTMASSAPLELAARLVCDANRNFSHHATLCANVCNEG
nr:CoA-transferase [Roseovarius gaetbuli]